MDPYLQAETHTYTHSQTHTHTNICIPVSTSNALIDYQDNRFMYSQEVSYLLPAVIFKPQWILVLAQPLFRIMTHHLATCILPPIVPKPLGSCPHQKKEIISALRGSPSLFNYLSPIITCTFPLNNNVNLTPS